MWLPVLGLIFGIALGLLSTVAIPVAFAKYLSIAVLASLDSLLGGWRAILEDHFDAPILLSGFLTNAFVAALLAYVGDILGLDLYLAAVVAFGLRIFSNIGFIRRFLIYRFRCKHQLKAAGSEKITLNDNEYDQQLNKEAAQYAKQNREEDIPTYHFIKNNSTPPLPADEPKTKD